MNSRSLRVLDVTAGYIDGIPIIKDVHIAVEPGEIVSIVGPNGAGKSTLLKSIAGLLPVHSGNIMLGSTTITGMQPDTLSRAGLAYVPQLDNIFRSMTVRQNLALAARRCRRNCGDRIKAMTSLFPVLDEKYHSRAGSLSGGQRQFLAIAMALIAEPAILLLDEPSAGLSPKAAQEVLARLQVIAQRDVAIVMVEQNVKAALQLSDRAYVLADGQNQLHGQALDVLNNPSLGAIFLGSGREQTDAAESV